MLTAPDEATRKQQYPETVSAPENSNRRLYSIMDLFAGCGGLSLGFENAGFTPVFVNELNNDALSTYLINRHHELGGMRFSENISLRCNDAHELDKKRLSRLKSDLSTIPEASLLFTKPRKPEQGGGSSLDIIAGGPPCQGFSGIGHRRSYAVDKENLPSNLLYVRMAEIIRNLRPRIFLFENVKGILNSKWTRNGCRLVWPDVLNEFRSINGYEVRWKLVYAKDYGVPQNRPRVLMVGIRKDLLKGNSLLDINADPEDAVRCGFLPEPMKVAPPNIVQLLGDLVDPEVMRRLSSGNYPVGLFQSLKYPNDPFDDIQVMLRHRAPFMPDDAVVELTEQQYSKHSPLVVKKFQHMINTDGEIPEHFKTNKFAQRVLPKEWGHLGPTITATSMPDDYVHYCQPRVLTVREWARLQLFPDWYSFAGKRTTGGIRRAGNPVAGIFEREVPKYTQIGNAVPVGLAQNIGLHFKSILDAAAL